MRFKRVITIVLLVISILLSVRLIYGYFSKASMEGDKAKVIQELNKKYDNEVKQLHQSKDVLSNSSNANRKEDKEELKNVIGKIDIDKLNLDYPILEGATEENLNISITRFYGSEINSIGNCVLAGHNMKDGSLFGRLSELSQGDKITLYDISGKKKKYSVFNIKVVAPTDLSVLSQETNNRCWITLITCTNQGKSRLIIQAMS